MNKVMKMVFVIIGVVILSVFWKFNIVYNEKDDFDLSEKILLLYYDPVKSEKILKKHGFEVKAEYQGLGGYTIYDLRYIYKDSIEYSISIYGTSIFLDVGLVGESTSLHLKIVGNVYNIYDNYGFSGPPLLGNENNYSEEDIAKVENYFTEVVNDTYQDYLKTIYGNPILGRDHYFDLQLKKFIWNIIGEVLGSL